MVKQGGKKNIGKAIIINDCALEVIRNVALFIYSYINYSHYCSYIF